jgi:hypothetical protein
LDLAGLAAFAIMRLHDLHIPNTFENLVVTLFKMFPTKFSLVGFDVYPDAARVGRTLLQLGPKYRNWARGSVNKGFVLTEAGKTKALSVSEVLSGLTPSSPKRVIGRTAPRTKDLSKDLQVLRDSPLYQQWKVGALSTTNSIELFNLLGAYAYTPPRVLRERIKMLESIAVELEQQEISEFLRAVRHNFSEELQD